MSFRLFAGSRVGRRGFIGVSVNPVSAVKGTVAAGKSIARTFPWAVIVAFLGTVVCIGIAMYMYYSNP